MRNKANVKRLQEQKCSHGALTDLKIDDVFAYLSINENTNDEHADDFDNTDLDIDFDFDNEYFADADNKDVTDDDENENEEDSEEDEDIESDLSEKQVKFGKEFFNMESSSIPIRDYDDLNERQPNFISLTCNIDGVAVYTSSEQSMWTFTACINELKRTIRFSMENIIVLAISVGRKKPSRVIMQKMLSPIVLRLKELQKPKLYQVSVNSYEMLRVYLIGISNYKPANSLVQNQPEPNALYGCSKCEIAGYTTAAKIHATPTTSKKITTTYVRIFPTPANDRPQMRSNARWHEISHALQNGHQFICCDKKIHSYGYLGECEFTNLAFVDRGISFMCDTLHTIYHGAFKRLLKLWIESSKKQPWSISSFLPLITIDLANIRYPSTTTRAPRNLSKCFKLKANESRVLLLIGYPIFKKYLPEVYYNHLKMLAFGITIGESRNISSKNLNDMELLLSSFVDNFPYHERYIVQNIHSVKHFAKTVNDFGPLFNYSTFNYESVIGYLSASIHGTKRVGSELIINLQLFKEAYFASTDHCSSSYLSTFIKYLDTKNKQHPKQRISTENISEDDLDLLYKSFPKEYTIKSMKSSKAYIAKENKLWIKSQTSNHLCGFK
ncbi:unnamed protein product [Rotaria sp. Silwood1]|nr:unnamed protein product [Rotaria sp. Silwood1]